MLLAGSRTSARGSLLLVIGLFLLPSRASAGIDAGDILVPTSGPGSERLLVRVAASNGAQELLASALPLVPRSVACTRSAAGDCERILVICSSVPFASDSFLISVDPDTGAQEVVTDQLLFATGIAVAPDGSVFVSLTGSIVEVDLATGAISPVSSFGILQEPQDLIVDELGDLLVIDDSSTASLIRVERSTGMQTALVLDEGYKPESCLLGISSPRDLVIEPTGTIAVAQNSCVWRYDRQSGAETKISQVPGLGFLHGIDVEHSGSLVAASRTTGTVLRIDPSTGSATTVTGGGFLNSPQDVFVVPDMLFVPEPAAGGAAALVALLALSVRRARALRRVPGASRRRALTLVGVVAYGVCSAGPSRAVLAPGDLLVVSSDNLVQVDPVTGEQSVLVSELPTFGPQGVACTRSLAGDCERVLVATRDFGGSYLVSVDPLTGEQELITDQLSLVSGVGVAPDGTVFVSQAGSVVEVDLMTGAITPVSSFGNLQEPQDPVVDGDGQLLVVDASAFASLIRIDPETGAQTVLVFNEGSEQCIIGISGPNDLVIEPAGTIAVAQTNCVWRFDPDSGAETTISQYLQLGNIRGIDVEQDGSLVAAASSPVGRVLRIDPVSGATTTITELPSARDVVVVPSTVLVAEPRASLPGSAALVALFVLANAQAASRRRRRAALPRTLGAALLVVLATTSPSVVGASLRPGDLLVVNSSGSSDARALVVVDPMNGAQRALATNLPLRPQSVACTRSPLGDCEKVLVLSGIEGAAFFPYLTASLLAIDPETGEVEVITRALAAFGTGIAVAPDGSIFVTQITWPDLVPSLVEVDLATGIVTPISDGGFFVSPRELIVEESGDLLVLQRRSGAVLVRVDPTTGEQSVVSADGGPCLGGENDLVIEPPGTLALAETACIWRYDRQTGTETTISQGGAVGAASGIDVEASGNLVVANFTAGVLRIDPASGAASTVTAGGLISDAEDVFVVPDTLFVPEPSASTCAAALLLSLFAIQTLRRSAR